MSRSNPTTNIKNPAVRWIEWDGSKGQFRYYDKEAGEKGKNVYLDDKEIVFLYLDRVGTVTGFSDSFASSIFSNQIRSSKKQELEVNTFNKKDGPLAKGYWSDIKDAVSAKGGKFTSNIYAAMKVDGELQIVCIQFKAAALMAWSDFEKDAGTEINSKAVKLVDRKYGKKGSIEYYTPVFKLHEVSEETDAAAIELDKTLQAYLDHAIKGCVSDNTEESQEEASEPVTLDEKKPLKMSDPNFATIMQNIATGQTTVLDVTNKYDVDDGALSVLRTTEENAVGGIDLDDDEDDSIPF